MQSHTVCKAQYHRGSAVLPGTVRHSRNIHGTMKAASRYVAQWGNHWGLLLFVCMCGSNQQHVAGQHACQLHVTRTAIAEGLLLYAVRCVCTCRSTRRCSNLRRRMHVWR